MKNLNNFIKLNSERKKDKLNNSFTVDRVAGLVVFP